MDDWIAETVRVFGANLGIDDLELDDEGGIELELEGGECLGIQHLPDMPGPEVLVYWSRPLHFDPGMQLDRALRLVNGRRALPWPAQAAIREGMLLLTMRMPSRAFDLPALELAVNRLEAMQAEAAG
jgi:type III secretion system chaperone SycN